MDGDARYYGSVDPAYAGFESPSAGYNRVAPLNPGWRTSPEGHKASQDETSTRSDISIESYTGQTALYEAELNEIAMDAEL